MHTRTHEHTHNAHTHHTHTHAHTSLHTHILSLTLSPHHTHTHHIIHTHAHIHTKFYRPPKVLRRTVEYLLTEVLENTQHEWYKGTHTHNTHTTHTHTHARTQHIHSLNSPLLHFTPAYTPHTYVLLPLLSSNAFPLSLSLSLSHSLPSLL